MDIESHEEYWISGVRKDQRDRHWTGSGKISIDQDVVKDYLSIIGHEELDSRNYAVTNLDDDFKAVKDRIHELENRPL